MPAHFDPTDLPTDVQELIHRAIHRLWDNDLVAFPTETVYGIGAHAARPEAVRKLFEVKGRPAHHPLIVHIPGAEWMTQWAQDIPQTAWDLARAFWPGPMTLILKKLPWVPAEVTGGQDTVGLRVPDHPITLALLYAFATSGRPGRGGIAAPSANRFGRISPTSAEDVLEELGTHASVILDGGPCKVGIESTIIDLSRRTPVILRPGAISPKRLAEILGKAPAYGSEYPDPNAPRVPGTVTAHYAPRTPTRLMSMPEILAYVDNHPNERCGILAYTLPQNMSSTHIWRMVPPMPEAYAHELYGALRKLDRRCADQILIETPPEIPEWDAIRDRLTRAAK